jgi:hypothetical protein
MNWNIRMVCFIISGARPPAARDRKDRLHNGLRRNSNRQERVNVVPGSYDHGKSELSLHSRCLNRYPRRRIEEHG